MKYWKKHAEYPRGNTGVKCLPPQQAGRDRSQHTPADGDERVGQVKRASGEAAD
ncbi:MAG: hypothetical protein WCB11_03070 [Terriglobales bacterium]